MLEEHTSADRQQVVVLVHGALQLAWVTAPFGSAAEAACWSACMRLSWDVAGRGVLQRGVRAQEACCGGPQRYRTMVLL
jgi:hypothetical protein